MNTIEDIELSKDEDAYLKWLSDCRVQNANNVYECPITSTYSAKRIQLSLERKELICIDRYDCYQLTELGKEIVE